MRTMSKNNIIGRLEEKRRSSLLTVETCVCFPYFITTAFALSAPLLPQPLQKPTA